MAKSKSPEDQFDEELQNIIKDKSIKLKAPKMAEGNIEMKNLKNNQTVKTIITVIITLALVGALGGMFWAGMNYESSKNLSIKVEAQKLVDELKIEQ